MYTFNAIHITDTFCIHITPVFSSRLGRNHYGANGYSPDLSVHFYFEGATFIIIHLVPSMNPHFQELMQ